jgi:hypothetical protein
LSLLAFGVWIAIARAAWPQGRAQWLHLAVTGVLMHAGYLGGVWAAVKLGMGRHGGADRRAAAAVHRAVGQPGAAAGQPAVAASNGWACCWAWLAWCWWCGPSSAWVR